MTTLKLRNGSVTLAKLAPGARIPGPRGPQGPPGGAGVISDGAVATAKLAANAVTGQKMDVWAVCITGT